MKSEIGKKEFKMIEDLRQAVDLPLELMRDTVIEIIDKRLQDMIDGIS